MLGSKAKGGDLTVDEPYWTSYLPFTAVTFSLSQVAVLSLEATPRSSSLILVENLPSKTSFWDYAGGWAARVGNWDCFLWSLLLA